MYLWDYVVFLVSLLKAADAWSLFTDVGYRTDTVDRNIWSQLLQQGLQNQYVFKNMPHVQKKNLVDYRR